MAADKKTDEASGPGPQIATVGVGAPIISARRISLWYGDVIGINNISLDIGRGIIGLLGPNGAGKSTLFKCLTGQLRPRTGAVTLHGKNVWGNPDLFQHVGFVPEQDSFYEEMTGHQFVSYLTELQGYDRAQAARLADEAIEQVGLVPQRDKKVSEYSKGMRQRIKIAQALAHKPDVLFLDEPLTGTDPVGRRAIIDLIRGVAADDKATVLVTSHVLHEIEDMTQNIVLINKGRIVADGDVYQIRDMIDSHPHAIFVDCDQPRQMAALLAGFDDIVSIEFVEGGLRVATREPEACYNRIPALALDHKLRLRRMTSPDNNLMAVFEYLVGGTSA
jgi:ABC-2 type transport system ATP-binding protein